MKRRQNQIINKTNTEEDKQIAGQKCTKEQSQLHK